MVWDKRIRRAVMGGMGIEFTNPEWPRRIQFYNALTTDTVAALHDMVQYVKQAGLDQQALALLQKFQPSTSISILKTIKIPVLVIHGDLDNDNGSADALAMVFPNSQKAVVPGLHNQALQTPEFAQAVLLFLNK
jgi:pimeloyl-ACP methyl ester carboxylesterase